MINARYRRAAGVTGTVPKVEPPAYRRSGRPPGGRVVPGPLPLVGGSFTPGPPVFAKRRLPDRDGDFGSIARFRATDGTLIVEVDLTRGPDYAVDELIAHARALGADKLWAHAHVVDAEFGFRRCGSYTRLTAERPPALVELASPPLNRVREIQRACFAGVWGHHDPGLPDPYSVFVGLHEAGTWVGICEVDPEAQWMDGPGVVPWLRTPDRYARLVRGAAAYLQNAPVALETWGDAASTLAAYMGLGFEVVHSVSGWELDLRER